MKNRYLKILAAFIAFVFVSCSSSQQVTSQQNNGNIKVDGDHSDWKQLNNMKGENISFGFSNDASNLYVSMITNDRSKIMKILRGGLEVWIDPGNSDDKIGIRFPEKPDPAAMREQFKNQKMNEPPNQQNNQKPEMQDRNEMDPGMSNFLAQQKELYVIDEDGKVLKSYPINGELYQASIKIDKNNLCYELKIPFGNRPLLNYNAKDIAEGKISVDFVSGDIDEDSDAQRPDGGDRPSGGPPSGGGGNPPSGGGPGGGPGGGMGGGPGGGGPGMGSGQQQDNSALEYSFDVLIKK